MKNEGFRPPNMGYNPQKLRFWVAMVLAYISRALTYLLGTVPCTLTMGYLKMIQCLVLESNSPTSSQVTTAQARKKLAWNLKINPL